MSLLCLAILESQLSSKERASEDNNAGSFGLYSGMLHQPDVSSG